MRFLHTSDWQLGMTRHFLEGEAQARYTGARIDAVRTLGAVAAREGCEFVVVAGDVFESNLVSTQTVRRSLEAMGAIGVPVYLLPGNHDPLDAVSVYRSRVFASARPDNVVVLDTPGVHVVRPGVELVAAPWFSKEPLVDLVGDALAGLGPAPGVRVVVGHGPVDVLNPDEHAVHSIALAGLDRAIAAGVAQYVALGDKHTRLSVGPAVHYCGSPEVTSFREERPGDVLVVDLDEADPQAPPTVTPHHVGTWRFVTIEAQVEGGADIEALDARLGALDPKDRTVVRTGLQGTLALADKARLDALLDAYDDAFAARLAWGGHDDVAVVVGDELTDLGVGGFVDHVVDRLARQAGTAGSDGGDGTARDALSLLYRLARGPAA